MSSAELHAWPALTCVANGNQRHMPSGGHVVDVVVNVARTWPSLASTTFVIEPESAKATGGMAAKTPSATRSPRTRLCIPAPSIDVVTLSDVLIGRQADGSSLR